MDKAFLKKVIGKLLGSGNRPAGAGLDFGDLNRTTPISTCFGYDRGGPLDRYYIEGFLDRNKELVRGRVLEIGDNSYTIQFGGANVFQSDIFHVDDSNPNASFTGDLANAPQIPDNSFDCIILTQTLQLVFDCKAVLGTCHRILKPGGVLLLTVPGISHIAQDEWGKYWQWSFTDKSVTRLLGESFSPEMIRVETHGNVMVAAAFLYGVGLPEVSKEKLEVHDPHFQVIITAVAKK